MPCRAISIIPLLIDAPINIPIAATINILLNDAALEPIAEFRKLTASLLTPTERSNTANNNRKMMTHKKIISIVLCFNFLQSSFMDIT